MKVGLFGKKLGMTQIFDETGFQQIPVSVIELYDATVLEHRSADENGYTALVLGFDDVAEQKLNKPQLGYLKKKQASPFRYVREIRVADPASYPLGSVLTSAAFEVGEMVNVAGVSKGKGFQGVIKRHGKAGGPAAHGSHFHRSTGSIGQRTYPGRVFKNMGMAGRMGGDQTKTKNLKIVNVDAANRLVFVRGSVPGTRNGVVFIETKKKSLVSGLRGTESAASAEANAAS